MLGRELCRKCDDFPQRVVLRYAALVPIATARKVESLTDDIGSRAALAELLGVNRSRITRWLQGEGIDPENAERIDLLEAAYSILSRSLEPDAIRAWLLAENPHVGGRRPIDLIRAGRAGDVVRALQAMRAGSFA